MAPPGSRLGDGREFSAHVSAQMVAIGKSACIQTQATGIEILMGFDMSHDQDSLTPGHQLIYEGSASCRKGLSAWEDVKWEGQAQQLGKCKGPHLPI